MSTSNIPHLKSLFRASENSGYALEDITAFEKAENIRLPNCFKDYLLGIGAMPYHKDGMFELRFPNMYKDEEYYVFYQCYYNSFRWAIHKDDLGIDNPPIYEQRFFDRQEVPWAKLSTQLAAGLFFMALMNGAFHGQLAYANQALVPQENFANTMETIKANYHFYGAVCENKIFFNDDFTAVILNEEFGVCFGTMDEAIKNSILNTLNLNWEH